MTDIDDARRRVLTLVAEGSLAPAEAAERLAALDQVAAGAAAAGPGGGEPPPQDPAPDPDRRDDDPLGGLSDLVGRIAEGLDIDLDLDVRRGTSRRRVVRRRSGGPARPRVVAFGHRFGADDPSGDVDPPLEPPPGGPAARVKVVAAARKVVVSGDAGVREAVAEGEHTARWDGDVLVVDGTPTFEEGDSGFRFHRGGGGVLVGDQWGLRPLRVRVRPDLPLELDVQAGSIVVEGMRGPITATVAAGSAKLRDFSGPLDVDVAAGSLKGEGRLGEGASKVRCQAGSVHLALDADSDVTVSGRADLGRLDVVDRIGEGRGTLDVEASLGSVTVVQR